MELPDITDLQFLVLEIVRGQEVAGPDLRTRLRERSYLKDGPAFYQMMGRMERSGFVRGRYRNKEVAGRRVKERLYKISGTGEKAYHRKLDFYAARLKPNPSTSIA